MTVPGLQEADFTFHGNPGTDTDRLASFIARALVDSGAAQLRLPLLTRRQANELVARLSALLPAWTLGVALAAVAPMARKEPLEPVVPRSLRVALTRAVNAGLKVDCTTEFPNDEIRAIHSRRWGSNRDDKFFEMLRLLLDERCAELLTARTSDGQLVAAQLDILGSATRHNYYSISDTTRAPRSGTAVLANSWRRFIDTRDQCNYSFGRGAEQYKFIYADACRELFELRGFRVPRQDWQPD